MNDPQARHIPKRIGEKIALDSQPFSIVEDMGFHCLVHTLEARYSRKYFSEKFDAMLDNWGIERE